MQNIQEDMKLCFWEMARTVFHDNKLSKFIDSWDSQLFELSNKHSKKKQCCSKTF